MSSPKSPSTNLPTRTGADQAAGKTRSNPRFLTSHRRNSDTMLIATSSSFLKLPFASKLRAQQLNQERLNSSSDSPNILSEISTSVLRSPDLYPNPLCILPDEDLMAANTANTTAPNTLNFHAPVSPLLSPRTPQSPSSPSSQSQQSLLHQKLSSLLKLGFNSNSNTNASSNTADFLNSSLPNNDSPVFSQTPDSTTAAAESNKKQSRTVAQYFNSKFLRKRHSVSTLKFASSVTSQADSKLSSEEVSSPPPLPLPQSAKQGKARSRGASPKPHSILNESTQISRFVMPFKLRIHKTSNQRATRQTTTNIGGYNGEISNKSRFNRRSRSVPTNQLRASPVKIELVNIVDGIKETAAAVVRANTQNQAASNEANSRRLVSNQHVPGVNNKSSPALLTVKTPQTCQFCEKLNKQARSNSVTT
jgi:hypothetical protein